MMAQVLSWAVIGRVLAMAASQVLAALTSPISRAFRAKRVKTLGKSMKIGSVTLGPAALKRAQLVARAGLQRLWYQSKTKTLASMLLGMQLVWQALTIRRERARAVQA